MYAYILGYKKLISKKKLVKSEIKFNYDQDHDQISLLFFSLYMQKVVNIHVYIHVYILY